MNCSRLSIRKEGACFDDGYGDNGLSGKARAWAGKVQPAFDILSCLLAQHTTIPVSAAAMHEVVQSCTVSAESLSYVGSLWTHRRNGQPSCLFAANFPDEAREKQQPTRDARWRGLLPLGHRHVMFQTLHF